MRKREGDNDADNDTYRDILTTIFILSIWNIVKMKHSNTMWFIAYWIVTSFGHTIRIVLIYI